MQIKISEKARQHIAKKIAFYGKKNRVPRIVIAERSCSGAVFRLHFEALRDCDIELQTDGITIYGSKDLLDEFGGFELDLEQFFFTSRLQIAPIHQTFRCNCEAKCPNSQKQAQNR